MIQVLDDLESGGLEVPVALRSWSKVRPILSTNESGLPLPHPLDFEWWFSRPSCDDLINEYLSTLQGFSTLALLGTPRLAEVLAVGERTEAGVHLFERRGDATEAVLDVSGNRIQVHPGDVAATWSELAGQVDLVIADPPWYPPSIATFMYAAGGMLAPLGRLLICCPGLGTRPAMPGERAQLHNLAARTGFVLERMVPSALTYESPPFELAALRASELPGFDPFWRRGDLMIFRRLPGIEPERPSAIGTSEGSHWTEVVVGRTRFRVNSSGKQPEAGDLDRVVEGDVLDSVSTRDPRRALVNVWTTSNRVFRSGRPVAVIDALARIAQGQAPQGDLGDSLQQLVRVESSALAALGVE
ncbi:MAG: hypothetical protein ACJ71T_01245 [Actinomycetales bacterium]